jgi:hypothetical protein
VRRFSRTVSTRTRSQRTLLRRAPASSSTSRTSGHWRCSCSRRHFSHFSRPERRVPTQDVDAPHRGARAPVAAIFVVYLPFYFDGLRRRRGALVRRYSAAGARAHRDHGGAIRRARGRTRLASLDLPRARQRPRSARHRWLRPTRRFRASDAARSRRWPAFFEPAVLATAKDRSGLLFVGTDHALQPRVRSGRSRPCAGLVVARSSATTGIDCSGKTWKRGLPLCVRRARRRESPRSSRGIGPPPHPYRFEKRKRNGRRFGRPAARSRPFLPTVRALGAGLLAVQNRRSTPSTAPSPFPSLQKAPIGCPCTSLRPAM